MKRNQRNDTEPNSRLISLRTPREGAYTERRFRKVPLVPSSIRALLADPRITTGDQLEQPPRCESVEGIVPGVSPHYQTPLKGTEAMNTNGSESEQVRSLLQSTQMNRQQLDTYLQNCRICGEPKPDGFRDGEPFWLTRSVTDWAATAKRSRSGLAGTQQRGMVATLLRRGTEQQQKHLASVDELLAGIANGQFRTAAEAKKQIVLAGHTVESLGPQLRTIKTRKQAVADRQRAAEEASEAERLQGEIDLLQAEIDDWLQPRQEKLSGLADEKIAAQRRSTDLHSTKTLLDSAPQWLQMAESSARSMIQASEQRGQYLASQISYCQRSIDDAEDELDLLPGRIQILAARASDFEGQQEANALRHKKTELKTLITRSRADLAAHEKEQRSLADRKNKLQQRLERIAELMLEVWPSPADLAD